MDYRVILSPTKGFWSEQGWQHNIASATQLSPGTEVVLSFKDDKDIKIIRRKDIQIMNRHSFLKFLIKVCMKRSLGKANNEKFSQFLKKEIRSEADTIFIDGKAFTLEDAERQALSSVWSHKPDVNFLVHWGRQFLHYHIASGDEDTIYVVSLSSPAPASWLSFPDKLRA